VVEFFAPFHNNEGVGINIMLFASTSELHWSNRWDISRWPLKAEKCSGVQSLDKGKRINLLTKNEENK
jgi:hypothetical protein